MRTEKQNSVKRTAYAGVLLIVLSAFSFGQITKTSARDVVPTLDTAADALGAGDLREAAAILEKILAKEPNNAAAHTLAGVAADRQNNLAKAEKHFAAAVRLSPRAAESRNNYGVILLRLGKNAEAAREFNASLKINPAQASALINLAQIRLAENNFTAARALFEKAQTIAPDVEILKALVSISLQLNEKTRAAAEYKNYANVRGENADLDLGKLLFSRNSLSEARQELETLNAKEPANTEVIALLSKVYLGQNEVKNAGKLLETAVASGTADGKIYNALADVYQTAGYPENAIPAMRLAIESEPQNDYFHARYGLLLIDSKAPAAAIIRLREYEKKFPQSAKIKFVLGIAQFSDGRNMEAEQSLNAALQIEKDFIPAIAYLGTVYAERGQFSDAAVFFERALTREPENAVLNYLLADALLKIQSSDAAKIQRLLETAIRYDDKIAGAHLALGVLLARASNWEKAAAEFEKVIGLEPETAEAYYQLGRILARLKRTEESKAALEKFKTLNEAQTAKRETSRKDLVRRLANVRF